MNGRSSDREGDMGQDGERRRVNKSTDREKEKEEGNQRRNCDEQQAEK